MRSFRPVLVSAALASVVYVVPAHAVVLENKWQAGQKLAYDMALDGSLNVNAAPDTGLIIAGVPLEVQLRGKAQGQMETLAVDNAGTGTVNVKVPQLSLEGEALGQKGELVVANGTGKVLLNGKTLTLGQGGFNPTDGAKLLINPPVSFKITRNGKLAGVEPVPGAVKPAAPPVDDKPVPVENALDKGALMQAVILQALPSLWPGHEVQQGDVWHALINLPNEAPALAGEKPFGDFQLTFDGTDNVNGKDLVRIKVDGTMELDPAALADINKDAVEAAKKPGVKTDGMSTLTALGQKVAGNIWFDPAAGQIEKAELQLNARTRTRAVKPGGKPGEESWVDFTGSLKLQKRAQA